MRYFETADELQGCNVDSCSRFAAVQIARPASTAFVETINSIRTGVYAHSLNVGFCLMSKLCGDYVYCLLLQAHQYCIMHANS